MNTFEVTDEEIIEAIHDTILMERCNDFVGEMLKQGVDINRICVFVKDYQKKYMYLKRQGFDVSKFTFREWYENVSKMT